MTAAPLQIRPMRAEEIDVAVDWAAAEGWNPGLCDSSCFGAVDPDGFLLGEISGEPVATISCVRYDDFFAFLGLYIVRPDLRGRGYGLAIWRAALAHAADRAIGLDGVVAQQENYRRSGFAFAHRNIRFCLLDPDGRAKSGPALGKIVPLTSLPTSALAADDALVFPAWRENFWRKWVAAPGHVGRALLREGALAAWGVLRPCRKGAKIGPLVAADRAGAEVLFDALVAEAGAGPVLLDVPEPNAAAVALARDRGLARVFETARMYRGPAPTLQLGRVFGITSFELG